MTLANASSRFVKLTAYDWETVRIRMSRELAEMHGVPYEYMNEAERTACDLEAAVRTEQMIGKYKRSRTTSIASKAVLAGLAIVTLILVVG